MSLTLRELRAEDVSIFDEWRADPRYRTMLRRPGEPFIPGPDRWWSVVDGERLRGYVGVTQLFEEAEVSVLTDPDAPCDGPALALLIAQCRTLGYRRLVACTYTAARAAMVSDAGFRPVEEWMLDL